MALRWGIASAGLISNDFVSAVKGLPKSEHEIVAVAARSLSSAETFAKTHQIPKFYEGYINLANDPEVQVVYIGAINPQHYEITKLMLENGKHVLCEKPFAMNENQARKIIELARSKKLFIMEAVWSRFFPVYREIDQLLKAGNLGEIKYVSATFGFNIDHVDRVKRKDLGGGATLDLGIYNLQFQQFVFKGLQPEKFVVAGSLNDDGVDLAASAIITYSGGKTAVVSCNAYVELPNEAVIIGTKGKIRIPLFWCPTSYELNGTLKEFPLIKNDGKFNYNNSAGLAYQAVEVRKQILNGKIESEIMPHDETIQLANWMDTMRKEVGNVFPVDLE